MRRTIFLIVTIISCTFLHAQQGNNWTFGFKCGVDFNQNPATGFLSAIADKDIAGNFVDPTPLAQTISDCDGSLLYYISSNGTVWNREHTIIPSLNKTYTGQIGNMFFVPSPSIDSLIYLFQFAMGNNGAYYSIFNNYLDSGRGDVQKQKVKFTDSAGYFGGIIKHENDTDYWILQKTNIYTINAYLLTKNGLSDTPVISSCIGIHVDNSGNEPNMRSSNNGRFIISPHMRKTTGLHYYYSIYDFNRATGKLSNERAIVHKSVNSNSFYSFAFSPNDSIIYAFGKKYISQDTPVIYQLATYGVPNISIYKPVLRLPPNAKYMGNGMQLGPDNRLYLGFAHDTLYRSLLYVKYPDVWGIGCGLVSKGLELAHGSSARNAQKFPCHSYPVKRINNRFKVGGPDGCSISDTIRFTFDGDSAFHSQRWYFGDGDSADGKSVVHQYKRAGSYYVRLACGLGQCGYKQWVGDSVRIKFKPNLSLLTNKTISCGYQTIDANIAYKYTDTLLVSWGDGTDTMMVDSSNNNPQSLQLQHIYTISGNYVVSCKAWNSNCYDSAAVRYTVKIDASPQTSFQTNNRASCGGSNFALIDTSAFDSIIQYRSWQLQNGSFDTSISTTGNNTLNIYLTDTGNYSVSLAVKTFQGCTDSLSKNSYIRISPIPDARISPAGKVVVCYNDSVKISVPYEIGSKYLWSNQDTNNFIYATKQGIYSATVWNKENCFDKSASVTLTFLAPFNASIKQSANKDTLSIQTVRSIASYQWLKDGNAFANNTNATIVHPTSGIYNCTLTDTSGCVAKTNAFTVIGISSVPLSEGIAVYPNPTSNELTVAHIPSSVDFIFLTDLSGKKYIQQKTGDAGIIQMSLGHLASGVYILQVGEKFLKVVVE